MHLSLPGLFNKATKMAKSHSPEIFTGFGVAGVITTSYLTGRAAYQSAELLSGSDVPEDRTERIKEQVKQTWRLYVPAGISGAVTITCIIAGARSSGQRTAAAVAAYSLIEKGFSDYREKVVEQIGANKEEKIRDELAQERINRTHEGSHEVVVLGGGRVLCCELYTDRYFRSDMEILRKAINTINHRINNQLYVELEEFYDLIGLSNTSHSRNVGWDSDKLMDLIFSAVITPGGEPCLAFDYNYVKPI